MFGLWSVGRIFEFIAGSRNFIVLYVLAGISGNICSFALIPSLSVGASSSLFGILFCLYIIQKYEEKISSKLKYQKPSMQLGNIILINIILNIGFGLFSSIFDWAAHLGGAIAGTLFGFALTTRHNWNLKIILSEKKQTVIKKTIFDYYQIYYFGIVLINILFSISFFNIKNYQISYGKALKKAANNETIFLKYSDLSQYEFILVVQNKETNPSKILEDALFLHKNSNFFPALKMYDILQQMINYNFASPEFSNDKNKKLITQAFELAKKSIPLPTELYPKTSLMTTMTPEICAKPATLFMTLGYFEIAGNLFECAYLLNSSSDSYAINSIESYYLAGDKKGLDEVLSIINFLDNTTTTQ